MTTLEQLVETAASLHASDLHLSCGWPPYVRNAEGALEPIPNEAPLTISSVKSLLDPYWTSEQQMRLKDVGDLDFPFTTRTHIRCRANAFRSQLGLGASIRLLPRTIPSMNDLRLPYLVQALTKKDHGLILFSAPTGNGKSTSIAALLRAINKTQKKRIITIEDPIEYEHESDQSLVVQREIGRDCPSFAAGLRSALREDPDIILIGEMRDPDTVHAALSAAESGHLVFSTLHAADVIQATDRILQYFPQGQQDQILLQFSNAFEAIIAQKLLPRRDKNGRIAAFEVLLRNDATRSLIRRGEAYRLHSYMHPRDGMQTMDASIRELTAQGLI